MDRRGRETLLPDAEDLLSNIARDKLPDGDHRVFMTSVRDPLGSFVCRAVLSLTVVCVGGGR